MHYKALRRDCQPERLPDSTLLARDRRHIRIVVSSRIAVVANSLAVGRLSQGYHEPKESQQVHRHPTGHLELAETRTIRLSQHLRMSMNR